MTVQAAVPGEGGLKGIDQGGNDKQRPEDKDKLRKSEDDFGHAFNLTWECDFCHPYIGKKSPGKRKSLVLYFTKRRKVRKKYQKIGFLFVHDRQEQSFLPLEY